MTERAADEVVVTRPGWQSSEFWTTIVLQLLTVLGTLGVMGDTDRTLLADASAKAIAAAAAFLANAWVVVRYIQSRTTVKAQAMQTQAVMAQYGVYPRQTVPISKTPG